MPGVIIDGLPANTKKETRRELRGLMRGILSIIATHPEKISVKFRHDLDDGNDEIPRQIIINTRLFKKRGRTKKVKDGIAVSQTAILKKFFPGFSIKAFVESFDEKKEGFHSRD